MSELVGNIRQLTQHASTDAARVLIDAAALVQEAVEAERERIAVMVEALGEGLWLPSTIAAMIREQGE